MTGLTSLYSHWNNQRGSLSHVPLVLASLVTRQATYRAFKKNKYGFMTSQSLPEITNFVNFFAELKDKKIMEDFEFLI